MNVESKSYIDETWDNYFPARLKAEEKQVSTKQLTFEVKAKQGCWLTPSKARFRIALKVRRADETTRFTNPTNADATTLTYHCWLINNAAAHIIKSIQVMPHGTHGVDVCSNYLSLEESNRFVHTTTKEKKKNQEYIYDRYYHKDLLCGPNENCCGMTAINPKNARQAAAYLLESHLYDNDEITLTVGPLPGCFHEIHQPISSLTDYKVKITLQSVWYMLLSRTAHADGTGATRDGARHLLNLDKTYLEIDYYQLPSDQNAAMQEQFLGKYKLLFRLTKD